MQASFKVQKIVWHVLAMEDRMNKGIVLAISGLCLAMPTVGQNINLNGVVKTSAGAVIPGAVVKLMSNGLQSTTDAQGKFQIKQTAGISRSSISQISATSASPIFIAGKGIQFGQSTSGIVNLQVYELSGRMKANVKAELGTGVWELNPGHLNAGLYFGRLKTPDGVQSFHFSVFNSQNGSNKSIPAQMNSGSMSARALAAAMDSLQASKANYTTAKYPLVSLIDTTLTITMDTAVTLGGSSLPGDIAAAAGTPLVAAHSMIRAMYKAYSGSLFQVRRGSDGKTQDIGPTAAGGPVNLTALKSFCSGTTCGVAMLYDQAGNGNDLPQTSASNQMVIQYWTTASGAQVPKAVTISSQYLRNRTNTKKIPLGAAAQTEYFVVDPKVYNAKCCWDYGNMELVAKVSSTNSPGKMSALNIGTSDNGYANPGAGSGPWGMVDYEAGVYSGAYRIGQVNPNNPSLTYPIATVLTKSNGTTNWVLKVGDATAGKLTTSWNGALPSGYNPLKQEGGLSLGEGGDGSKLGTGAFFEGVVIAAVTTDATDNAIQAGLQVVFK